MTGPGPLFGGVNSFSPLPSHAFAEKAGTPSAAGAGNSAAPAPSIPITAPAKASFDIGFLRLRRPAREVRLARL